MIKNKNIIMILDNAFNPDLRVQKEINSLIKLGFSVDLICWDLEGELPESEKYENFNIYRVKIIAEKQQGIKKIFDLIKFFRKCIKKINSLKVNYDFFYAHDFLMLPIGVYLKMLKKKPLIYDAHEIYHIMEWEKYPRFLNSFMFFVEKQLLKFTDELIVVNKKRKEFYSKYYKGKDIKIIGNWYDPYNGESVSLRKMYSIPNDGVLLSYFGVINFYGRPIDKIIEKLIVHENLYFFIAGVGKDEKLMSEMASKNKHIYYLGWQKNIRKFMSDIDFMIYYQNDKRKYFEYSAPNTLYLAISHKIPLISNVPGEVEELIQKFKIGYFIKDLKDLESKIEFDINSKSYTEKLEGISNVKDQFNWSENEKKYSQIFEALSYKSTLKRKNLINT